MRISTHTIGIAALVAMALCGCGGFEVTLPDAKQLAASEKTYDRFEEWKGEGHLAWIARNTVPDAERPATLKKAIEAYEKAWQIDPTAEDVLERLAIATYYHANYYIEDEAAKEEAHKKGFGYAIRGLLLDPDIKAAVGDAPPADALHTAIQQHLKVHQVPLAFWMCANWARIVENKGIATRADVAPKMKTIMETVYRLGPRYHFGAVHRFFGGYFTKAPGVADPGKRSLEEFQRALEVGPQNLENKVLMAEYYAKFVQDRDLFERLLKEVIAAPDDFGPSFLRLDNSEAKKRAQRLLAEADDLF